MNILLDEDYIGINETIQFEIEDREMIVQTLILDDSQLEDVEEFLAVLTPIAGVFPVAVQNGTAVVSIADNDGEIVVIDGYCPHTLAILIQEWKGK